MYEDLDATALAELVATRQVSPAELLEDAIARTDASAATLNAVPIRFDDAARAQASAPLTGPFAGVPFLLKDIGQEYAGQLFTAGAARPCTAPTRGAAWRRAWSSSAAPPRRSWG